MKVAIKKGSLLPKRRNRKNTTAVISTVDNGEPNTGQSGNAELSQNRMTLEKLRAIWNDKDEYFTDTQLLQIRDWFYTVAEVSLSIIARLKKSSVKGNPDNLNLIPSPLTIPILHTAHNEAAEESYSLHPRIYRRAS